MKTTIVAAGLLAVTVSAGAAVAADMSRGTTPYYGAPAAAPLPAGYRWSGPYAGLNAGYHWGTITNSGARPKGIAGGLQAGYNWQSGQFVFGGETDLQLSGADDTFAPYKFSNPWFGTLRARAGWALNNILFYGTLGLAYGGVKAVSGGLEESRTETGWTAGLGMEVGLTPNWSAKAEYLYMDLGNRGFTVTGASNGFESNLLRFGINYHF